MGRPSWCCLPDHGMVTGAMGEQTRPRKTGQGGEKLNGYGDSSGSSSGDGERRDVTPTQMAGESSMSSTTGASLEQAGCAYITQRWRKSRNPQPLRRPLRDRGSSSCRGLARVGLVVRRGRCRGGRYRRTSGVGLHFRCGPGLRLRSGLRRCKRRQLVRRSDSWRRRGDGSSPTATASDVRGSSPTAASDVCGSSAVSDVCGSSAASNVCGSSPTAERRNGIGYSSPASIWRRSGVAGPPCAANWSVVNPAVVRSGEKVGSIQ